MAQMTPLSVSVVIPAYNEEESVEKTTRLCVEGLRRVTARGEVVIVDDGSSDRTAAIAERLKGELPEVRLVRNPVNLGVGISILVGFAAATGDIVLHNAMDYPFHMEDLERILPLFPRWDVVIAARPNRAAHAPWRKVTSWVNYWMVRILFGVNFKDMNFIQVYKREVLRSVTVKAKSPAFVTPELLIRARDHGYAITSLRVIFHPREKGEAHYGRPRDILWTLADMISFWLERLTRA
ncbi:MAG: glycosyltransferase family 2 protein [Candidatus Omnitrophota bacterium]